MKSHLSMKLVNLTLSWHESQVLESNKQRIFSKLIKFWKVDSDHCFVVSPLDQNFLDAIAVSCKNLMILNINFILICLWLLVLFNCCFYWFIIEIRNWMRKCSSKSHLTVKIYISYDNFYMSLQHPWQWNCY